MTGYRGRTGIYEVMLMSQEVKKLVTADADISKIMDSFYKLVGPLVTFSGKKYESHEQLVEEFFELMDTTGDGKITLKEYKEGAMKNPDVIQIGQKLRIP